MTQTREERNRKGREYWRRKMADPEHREKRNAQKREAYHRRAANPEYRERMNAKRRQKRAEDPEYREKVNAKQREAKRRKRAGDPEWREKQNTQRRRRYAEDSEYREERIARQQQFRERRRVENRALIAEFQRNGCIACGEMGPLCLVAHHRDPSTKSFNVATGAGMGFSEKRMREELAKCECLCANCHTRLTPRKGSPPPQEASFPIERAIAFSPGWRGWGN